jgi:arginase
MPIINFFDNFIIAECNQGQRKEGVQFGGKYISEKLNIKPKNIINNELFNSIENKEDNGYQFISNILSTQKKTMLIGGDHSLGISSVDAFINMYKNELSVLWIDAHADINDHLTSLTGNIHGMSLGYHHHKRADKPVWRTNPYKLKSSQLYYFGIRDLDPAELELIKNENIGYSIKVDDNLYNFINNSKYLLISFDVDALDPKYMDSTGVIAEDGLKPLDVKHIINYSINLEKLIHLDLMEFNPSIGNAEKSFEAIKYIFN